MIEIEKITHRVLNLRKSVLKRGMTPETIELNELDLRRLVEEYPTDPEETWRDLIGRKLFGMWIIHTEENDSEIVIGYDIARIHENENSNSH